MDNTQDVLRIPVYIDENEVDVGVRKILAVICPDWLNSGDILKCRVFSEGLSNKMYGYYLEDEPEKTVVVKIYGAKTETIIDRGMEIEAMKLLHKEKLGSKLYAIFENGIAYEFMNGKTLDTETCYDPVIANLVAVQLAKFHSVAFEKSPAPEGKKSMMWDLLWRINDQAEEALTTNANLIAIFKDLGITSGYGTKAINELKKLLEAHNMPLAFCHNDLLLGNIVYDAKGSSVSFIDFEYCGLNYAPFDICNHFCEFAGGSNTDFSKCPDENFKSKWLATYLPHLFGGNHSFDVKTFLKWVNICEPLSFLYWILWGIAQANNSTLDVDYVGYVKIRKPEYDIRMKGIRSCEQNS